MPRIKPRISLSGGRTQFADWRNDDRHRGSLDDNEKRLESHDAECIPCESVHFA